MGNKKAHRSGLCEQACGLNGTPGTVLQLLSGSSHAWPEYSTNLFLV